MNRLLNAALLALLVFAMLIPLNVSAFEAGEGAPTAYPDYDDYGPYDFSFWEDIELWEIMGYDTIEEFMDWYADDPWGPIQPGTPFWETWGSHSDEAFMSLFGLDEEEYLAYEEAWQAALERSLERRMRELEDMGGTYGIINVKVNDAFMKFPGAVPENVGGLTFVPAAPFFSAVGWSVRYDEQSGALTAASGGSSIRLVIGEDESSFTVNGATKKQQIAAAPYIKDGVSYIPLRSVANNMGFFVTWDMQFGAAVVIDRDKLAAEIDKDFTVVNSFFNMPMDVFLADDGAYRTVLEMLMSITQFNTIDGDATAHMDANATIISDGLNYSMAGTADLSELINYIISELNASYYYDEEETALLEEQLGILEKIEGELILNFDEAMMYVKSPLIGEFVPGFPADAWVAFSDTDEFLDGFDLEPITGGATLAELFGDMSVGSYIVSDLDFGMSAGSHLMSGFNFLAYFRGSNIWVYEGLLETAEFYKAIFGDARFDESNGAYSTAMSLEEYNEAAREYGKAVRLTEFDLKLTIKTSGGAITGLAGALTYREAWSWSGDTRYIVEFDINPQKVRISADMHERNSQKLILNIDATTAKVNVAVPKAPPAGAIVMAFEELMDLLEEFYPLPIPVF